MKALRLLSPLVLFSLLLGCGIEDPYEPPHEVTYENLLVPAEYASIAEAASAAEGLDTIRVAPGEYEESFILPPNISLFGTAADQTFIIGQITIIDSDRDTRLERVHLSNPGGSGLLLVDTDLQVSYCRFEDSMDAGIEIAGNCAAEVERCQITGNARGVLIRDSDRAGHYWDFDHITGTAPKITSSNLFDNGGSDVLSINIIFENVSAPDTIGVSSNYWGVIPAGADMADLTIYDAKDGSPHENGYADTTEGVLFLPYPHTIQW